MEDDSPRPLPGRRPEQSGLSAPQWWDDLERDDLPGDGGRPLPWYTPEYARPAAERAPRRLTIVVAALVVVTLAITGVLVMRTAGPDEAATALTLFGLPAVLAALALGWLLHRGAR